MVEFLGGSTLQQHLSKVGVSRAEAGKKSGGKGGAGYYKNDENVDDSTNTDTNNTKTSSRGAKGLSSRTAIRSQAYEQNAAALRIQTSFRGNVSEKKSSTLDDCCNAPRNFEDTQRGFDHPTRLSSASSRTHRERRT